MMNINRNIHSLIRTLLCVISAHAMAGTALIFDSPNLVVYKQKSNVFGFYAAENEKFSCDFLFVSNHDGKQHPAAAGYNPTELLTFVQSDGKYLYDQRDPDFDVRGVAYTTENEWILHTDIEQAGCGNAMGIFSFSAPDAPAFRYYITKKIQAVGVRTVTRKSFIYDKRSGTPIRIKGYVTNGDNVLVIHEKNGFSYIRFFDPKTYVNDPGKATYGWVHSTDLVNPFPPAVGQ
jgi:hypothetical protein